MNLARWRVSPKTYSVLYGATAIAAVLGDVAWSSWRQSDRLSGDGVTFAALAFLFASFAVGLLWWLRYRERAREGQGYRTDTSMRGELAMMGITVLLGIALRRLSLQS